MPRGFMEVTNSPVLAETGPEISVVVPVFNEKDNLRPFYAELCGVMDRAFEILFINDGSQDGSSEVLNDIAHEDGRVRVFHFRRNFGQTAAMDLGFKSARGEFIFVMDADRQNDPRDIPRLLARLKEGFDLVSGWRKDRKDNTWSRKVPSWLANRLIARLTRVRLHDYGCSLKGYRRSLIRHIDLYGEMHRFIPVYAAMMGARITEEVVNHRPRQAGKTKYGISRTFRVVLDLMTVHFFLKFRARPLHLIGWPGIFSLVLGLGVCGYLAALKIFWGAEIGGRPLLILGILLVFVGVQFLALGLLAEILIRTYYEATGKAQYVLLSRFENGQSFDAE